MRLWTRYAEVVASEAVKLPSFVKNIQPELQRMPRAEALAAIERIPDPHIRARWRKAATGGIAAADLKPSIARLTEMVERMDRALQDAPWLAGEEVALPISTSRPSCSASCASTCSAWSQRAPG